VEIHFHQNDCYKRFQRLIILEPIGRNKIIKGRKHAKR